MKNRKDIIDLIRNTDEETMEKLVKDYPQSDKKKADKLFRRIERRVEGTDAAGRDELIEVSGVERYRPQKFRRVVSAAACIALVGAGIGTAYAVKANAPSGKSPASEVTEEVPSDMAAAASRSVPENIDKDYIIELCSNARSNYSALSISYTNTNSNDHPSDHIYTGTMQIDNTADTFWAQEDVDILWKGSSTKKYSGFFFACGNNKVFRIAEDEEKYRVDNNNPGPDSMFYRPEKWVSDWLSPVENWDIGDKLTYIGRDCISIHGNRRIDNYDISFTAFIDTETGIPLHFKQKGQYQNVFDVNSITYNDNTGFMTKDGFREFLKDYEPAEEDYDLSFLNDEPAAAETTEAIKQEYPTNESGLTYGPDAPWAITIDDEPDLQAVIGDHGTKGYCYKNDSLRPDDGPRSPEEAIARQEEAKKYGQPGIVLFVYESDGKTIVDTFTQGSRDNKMPLDISLVFASLDSLDYEPISCDGLPTHKLTSPLGTIYYIHLGDTAADSYVWRRPSLVSAGDNEAPLTDYAFAALHENWDSLDIIELNYKD